MKSTMDQARETISQEKADASNRKQMIRRSVRIRHRAVSRPFARFRSGLRTGTTPHFRLWMAELSIKSALQRTSLVALADRHDNATMATAYALLSGGGFKSVWDLTQATKSEILAVKGIGPNYANAVKADLASRMVAVNW